MAPPSISSMMKDPSAMKTGQTFTSKMTQVLEPSVFAPQVLIPAQNSWQLNDTQSTEDKRVKLNIIGYTKLFLQLFIQ